MDGSRLAARRFAARSAFLALAALSVTAAVIAVGHDGDGGTRPETAGTHPPARTAAPDESSPAASSPSRAAEDPSASTSPSELDFEDQKRIDALPSNGVPITEHTPTGIPQGGEDFGRPVAVEGDVTVYEPVAGTDSLTVPIKITNSGKYRTFYDVTVRITGPGGFDAAVHMDTGMVGVYPDTSWPSELTAKDPGKPLPAHPKVTITRVTREGL